MLIYLIKNQINNKRYIGKTVNNEKYRFKQHIRESRKNSRMIIHKAIRKYGEENFIVEILEDNINDIKLLNEREIFWISELKPEYNVALGGNGGFNLNDEQKLRRALNLKEWNLKQKGMSYEEKYGVDKAMKIKENISKATKGKKLSEEQRLKIKGRIPWNKGIAVDDETKEKISNTMKEKKINVGERNGMNTKPESRKKIGEKNSKEHRIKNTVTGEEFTIKNLYSWCRSNNLNPSTVTSYFFLNKPYKNFLRLSISN